MKLYTVQVFRGLGLLPILTVQGVVKHDITTTKQGRKILTVQRESPFDGRCRKVEHRIFKLGAKVKVMP